jgi:hypothetical protein
MEDVGGVEGSFEEEEVLEGGEAPVPQDEESVDEEGEHLAFSPRRPGTEEKRQEMIRREPAWEESCVSVGVRPDGEPDVGGAVERLLEED